MNNRVVDKLLYYIPISYVIQYIGTLYTYKLVCVLVCATHTRFLSKNNWLWRPHILTNYYKTFHVSLLGYGPVTGPRSTVVITHDFFSASIALIYNVSKCHNEIMGVNSLEFNEKFVSYRVIKSLGILLPQPYC